ncbi:SDR family oxidoreductase [Pseudonocardia kujensis]|nr:SDR family oxidoreductase [Pseudonocardia kujensis]
MHGSPRLAPARTAPTRSSPDPWLRGDPRVRDPEDLAGLVSFLASPDVAWITGQSIVCDGGGLLR